MGQKEIGKLEAHDDQNSKDYIFIVSEEREGDSFVIRIAGNIVTGTFWTKDQAGKSAQKMQALGVKREKRGSPYVPTGKSDKRSITYELLQEGGKPTAIEISVTTLKADGAPYPEKKLTVKWPEYLP